MRFRWVSAGFVVSMALLTAACGGAGGGGGSEGAAGAEAVPAGVPVFVSVNSDLGSDQWKKLKALIARFPDHKQAEALLQSSISQQGVDWENDVKPAIGDEIVIVWTDLQNGGNNVILLTQPKDEGKFKDLIAKANKSGDNTTYTEKVGDWWAVSNSQSLLSSFKDDAGGKKLADNENYKSATGDISGDSMVTVYVDGAGLAQALQSSTASGGSAPLGLDKLDYLIVRAQAKDDGLQVDGSAKGSGTPGEGSAPFKSKLISGVPEGALAFADFHGGAAIEKQIESLNSVPQFQSGRAQFERSLGVKLEEVLALLQGEVAFYVRPSTPLPEFTLVLEETNLQSALSTLDTIATRAAALGHGQVTTSNQGGVPTKTVRFENFAVTYGGFDDRIVITSGASGIRDYRAEGGKLPDDPLYKDATGSAGVPDENSGLLYVNLKDAIPTILNFATTAGTALPPLVERNLAPLRSFVAYGTGESGKTKFTAFLQIK